MRILVTGGTGQIGWALRRTLKGLGEIIAPARDRLDLASVDSIVAAVRGIGPDIIVNAAAYTAVDRAETQPDLAMKINGEAPRILAEEAQRLNVALVHYSTDYVFDGRQSAPYREDDETAPLNVYGRTKLAGEHGVIATGAAYLALRTSWIYGPRGRNFLRTMQKRGRDGQALNVVDDQFGAPTTANQIAEATATVIARSIVDGALDLDRFRETSGLYHLSAAGQTTWYGFAQAILAGTRGMEKLAPTSTAAYPTPARRPQNSVLDNSRFERRFGFRLPHWRVGLERCLDELGQTSDSAPCGA